MPSKLGGVVTIGTFMKDINRPESIWKLKDTLVLKKDISLQIYRSKSKARGIANEASVLVKDGKNIGTIMFTPTESRKDREVNLSFLSKNYRGKGLGMLMYISTLEYFGSAFSGNILSPASRAVWHKLSNIFPDKVSLIYEADTVWRPSKGKWCPKFTGAPFVAEDLAEEKDLKKISESNYSFFYIKL